MKISPLNAGVGEDIDNNMVSIKVENPETVKNETVTSDQSSSLYESAEDVDILECNNCLNSKFKNKQTQEENVLLKKQMKAKDEHIDRMTESNNRVKRIYRERNAAHTEKIQEMESEINLLKEKILQINELESRNASQSERIQKLERENNLLQEKSSRIDELEDEVKKLKAENRNLTAETTAEKRKSINIKEKLKEEINKRNKSIEDQLKFWNNERSDLDETVYSEWEEPSFDYSEDFNQVNDLNNQSDERFEPPSKKPKNSY